MEGLERERALEAAHRAQESADRAVAAYQGRDAETRIALLRAAIRWLRVVAAADAARTAATVVPFRRQEQERPTPIGRARNRR